MSVVQDIYNIKRAPGQLAFGHYQESEILSNRIDDEIFSGQFLTFSSLNVGSFSPIKNASQNTARVIGMVPYMPQYTSKDAMISVHLAGSMCPYIKRVNLVYVKTNVAVIQGEQVYIDITNVNADLRGNITNVSSGNLMVSSAYFEQSADANSLALISFNLPN